MTEATLMLLRGKLLPAPCSELPRESPNPHPEAAAVV